MAADAGFIGTLPDTDADALVLDAPLRFVVPLAGPFGALLLLAMAWLSLP